jgi:hydrogenase maturation protein HypF
MPITTGEDGMLLLDPVTLLVALGARRRAGENPADLAAAFHETLAEAAAQLAQRVAESEGLDTVALGGGTFQNQRLLASLLARLQQRGLAVLVPRRLPPNDGAIAFGQVAVAAARLAQED